MLPGQRYIVRIYAYTSYILWGPLPKVALAEFTTIEWRRDAVASRYVCVKFYGRSNGRSNGKHNGTGVSFVDTDTVRPNEKRSRTGVHIYYSSEASFEFPPGVHPKKKSVRVCVRLILVLVWKNCLGFSVGYVLCASPYSSTSIMW